MSEEGRAGRLGVDKLAGESRNEPHKEEMTPLPRECEPTGTPQEHPELDPDEGKDYMVEGLSLIHI